MSPECSVTFEELQEYYTLDEVVHLNLLLDYKEQVQILSQPIIPKPTVGGR